MHVYLPQLMKRLRGIAKVNLMKLNKEKELKNKIKDEVDIIGIRDSFDNNDKNC